MSDFIKQQQELAREELYGDFLVFKPTELDTLIQQTIHNTGEKMMRLAEGEKITTMVGMGLDEDEKMHNAAIDTIKQHITNVTGLNSMKHNTREVVEDETNRIYVRTSENPDGELLTGKEVTHWLHHQLQKARHDWLREEIVKLEAKKEKQQAVSVYKNFRDDIYGYNLALQTIIDRYNEELDQPNK